MGTGVEEMRAGGGGWGPSGENCTDERSKTQRKIRSQGKDLTGGIWPFSKDTEKWEGKWRQVREINDAKARKLDGNCQLVERFSETQTGRTEFSKKGWGGEK